MEDVGRESERICEHITKQCVRTRRLFSRAGNLPVGCSCDVMTFVHHGKVCDRMSNALAILLRVLSARYGGANWIVCCLEGGRFAERASV